MSHTVEILSVGTELLLGNIVNADAQMLSQGLSELGLNVYYHTVVGDNPNRARQAVEMGMDREFMRSVMQAIHEESIRQQQKEIL